MGKRFSELHEDIKKRSAYQVPPELIQIPKGWNPRKEIDKDGIERLAKSIAESGLKVPIHVRREGDTVVLVDGERRLRAVLLARKKLGVPIKTIPVEIEGQHSNETDALVTAVVANEHREDVAALDRAEGYKRLLDFGLSTTEISRKLGRDNEHVTRALRLLKAAPAVRKALKDGIVTPSVVAELVRRFENDPAAQEAALADALAASGGGRATGKSVRKAAAKAKGKKVKPRRRTVKHKVLTDDIDKIAAGKVASPDGDYLDGFLDALKYTASIDDRPDWLDK